MSEKVFLIAINYNGLEDTMEFISSVNHIEYPNYHIVIVDNASTKGDLDSIPVGEHLTVLRSDKNLGFSGGNNLGIDYALKHGADYIVLINNDTVVEPDFLNNAIAYLQENPNIGVLTGKIMYAKQQNSFWYAGGILNYWRGRAYHIGSNEEDQGQYNQIREISFCTGCLMIIPRGAIIDVGMMSEEYFLYFEDTEYSARFTEKSYKIVYHPGVKIYHKVSASTGSSSPTYHYYNWRNRLYFISEHVHGLKKFFAYSFYVYEGMKRILSKELPIALYKRSICDFYNKVKGQVKL